MIEVQGELIEVKLTDIHRSPIALRTVDKESQAYIEMRDSIALRGIIQKIIIRENLHDDIKEPYLLGDGDHRFTCAEDLGWDTIKAINLGPITDQEALEIQMILNSHNISTQTAQYGKQLRRIFKNHSDLQLEAQAQRIGKSVQWIKKMMGLDKLHPDLTKMVDDGIINATKAMSLCQLPLTEQIHEAWVDKAQNQNTEEFVAEVAAKKKELKKGLTEVGPIQELQPKFVGLTVAKQFMVAAQQEYANDPTEKNEASKLMAELMLKQDAGSKEEYKREAEEKDLKRKRKASERDAEKKKKQLEAAQATLAEATEAAEAVGVA